MYKTLGAWSVPVSDIAMCSSPRSAEHLERRAGGADIGAENVE